MEKQFATYSISLELKELGFDEKCDAVYNPRFFIDGCWETKNSLITEMNINSDIVCSAPLWQQAQDWFWKNHNILISPYISQDQPNTILWQVGYDIYPKKEDAFLKAIEIVKEKLK